MDSEVALRGIHGKYLNATPDGKIVYGKANDSTAIILRFDFDPAEMAKRLQDLDVMEKVAEVVEKREMFSISPMQRP